MIFWPFASTPPAILSQVGLTSCILLFGNKVFSLKIFSVRQQAVPYFLPKVEAEMDERINYSTIQNLKELTDGKYEDLDKGDIDEGSFTKGIFADGGAITDEDEVGYHAFVI